MEENNIQQDCGIYKIENLINAKKYIGQSICIEKRWKEHKFFGTSELGLNYEESKRPLYCAIRKYGIENFSFERLELCKPEELDEREMYWIEYYNSFNNGYNLTLGGQYNDGCHKYDYQKIYEDWSNGLSCKELMKKYNCGDGVITSALKSFSVSENETKSRAQNFKKIKIVALSSDKKPLKIFNSLCEVSKYFYNNPAEGSRFKVAIENNWRQKGYYWDYLSENNYPEKELTDEEFLSYQFIRNIKKSSSLKETKRPSREELKNLIRTKPILQIGKMFNVSDNAVRKWCDKYNLPRKKREINSYSDEEWDKI